MSNKNIIDEKSPFLKKRWIIILISVLLVIAIVASFFLVTAGRTYEADGVRQNSRMYMKDIRYENGKLYCTFVNNTWHRLTVSRWTPTEKWINGRWQSYSLHPGQGTPSIACILDPFDSYTQDQPVTCDKSELVGKYRLKDGDYEWVIVGYFEITEEMLA